MTIRPAADADWLRVGALGEILVATHYAFDRRRFVHPDTLPADAYISHLRQEVAHGLAVVHVAAVGDGVAGYVFAGIEPESWKDLRDEAGYIHDLVVDAGHRRGGIGRALVESAVRWFADRGINRVMLGAAPANTGAQHLFRSLGFRPSMIEMMLER